MPAYDTGKSLPVTEDTSKRILTLPLYPDLEDGEIDRIIKNVEEYF